MDQPISKLTPSRKKKQIVVIDEDNSMVSSESGGGTKIMMIKSDSLNTMIEQQFLSNLAYT